jgi:hypothetical protein
MGNPRVVLDELSVVACIPEDCTYFFDGSWLRPLGQSAHFGQVHLDLPFADYYAKILNFSLFELAFLGLKV